MGRKKNTREVKRRILILCEGKVTEKLYLESIKKEYQNINTTIDFPEVSIEGLGFDPLRLLKKAEEKTKDYDRIWLVFDRDDHTHFDDVIEKAQKANLACAWSNEAIELWFLLHFEYLQTSIGRGQYNQKLTTKIQEARDKEAKYGKSTKEATSFIEFLKEKGNKELAKRNAKKLEKEHSGKKPSDSCPCTKIHHLIEELENPGRIPLS